jgi:hypothetical protein
MTKILGLYLPLLAGSLIFVFPVCSREMRASGGSMVPESVLHPLIAKSGLIFSFSVESITPLFAIDDMPNGYNLWSLKGRILKIHKGTLGTLPDSVFESRISIYQGPVRSRPEGLWVNVIPKEGEKWVLFCGSTETGLKPEKLLDSLGKSCLAVFRLEEVKRVLDRPKTQKVDTSIVDTVKNRNGKNR